MRKVLLLLITGILIIGGMAGCTRPVPTELATVPADYFPVGINNRWDYSGEGNEYASYVWEMPYVKDNQAQSYINNGGIVGTDIFRIDDNAITRVFFAGEEIFFVEKEYEQKNMLENGFTSNDHTVILKSPIKKGTVWKNDNETREIVAIDAHVNTPAGDFSDCLQIKITHADSSIVFEYYAAGVGLVKRESIYDNFRVTSILQEYSLVSGQ